MNKKNLLENYDEYYEKASFIDQQKDLNEVKYFAQLSNHVGQKLKILDIGSAEGELVFELHKMGHTVTAADISKIFLEKIKKKAISKNIDIETIFLDIEKEIIKGKEEYYDIIYFMDVIEHLKNPSSALLNIRKMLANTGKLIIHTPNLASISLVYRYIKSRNKLEDYFLPQNLSDFHLLGYDYQTLEKACNFAGLQIEKIFPTYITLPVIYKFSWSKGISKALSKLFPKISDTLLVLCKKVEPIDIEQQLKYWKNKYQ
jgi:2-polyprenyl-3-methyl-5-hydroxy-6-metoxy-1,4-benzoquinol methylase